MRNTWDSDLLACTLAPIITVIITVIITAAITIPLTLATLLTGMDTGIMGVATGIILAAEAITVAQPWRRTDVRSDSRSRKGLGGTHCR